MSKLITALMVAAMVIIGHFTVSAQATTGTLKGVVVDATGSVVAGANVKVKSEGTGIETTVVTNSDGSFTVSALTPGNYTVTTEASGFKRSVKTGVQVNAGVANPANVSLEAGNVSETVTVTASTEDTLQTTQSQISTTIDTRRVEDLPSNGAGGGIDTLALLVPGVIANRVGGTNTNGTGLSVNGNRGRSNNFQIDGSDNNDLSVGGPALFVDFQDSVQEFQVITNNFDARFGRNQGAIINIVGKSGTNNFHGSAFWHHQDAQALNSLNNIQRRDGTTENDRFLYNVFGGTVGGPVYLPDFGSGAPGVWSGKDHAFFFLAYQGIRNPSSTLGQSLSLGILPSEFGRLQSTFPGNAVVNTIATFSPWAIPGAQLNINPSSAAAVTGAQINLGGVPGCTKAISVSATPPVFGSDGITPCGAYTTPLNPATGQPFLIGGPYDVLNWGTAANPAFFQAAQYQRTQDTTFTEDYWNLRFDVRASNKDNISFRWLRQASDAKNALQGPSSGFNGDVPAGSTNYGGNWSRAISNSMLNDLRVNYQKIKVDFGGGCDAATPGCIPSSTKIDVALANIAFSPILGLTKTNTMPTIGPATNLPQGRTGQVYQFADNLSWNTGKHAFTFGAEFKYLKTLTPFLPGFNGIFSYNTTGIPTGAAAATRIINNAPSAVTIVAGDPLLNFPEKDQYYFVQDDFKVKPNLTLNLGVRYEYTGQPINELNKQSVARESNAATALYDPTLPLSVRTVPTVPADKNNFAPRFGFAYTPHFWKKLFGDDATVFRGGYSIAYDAAFYNILTNVMSAAPFAASLVISPTALTVSGNPSPLPNNPFGNTVRAAAQASGVLPLGKLNPTFLSQTTVAPDYKSPFAEQWSFGVQRLLGKKHIVEARYVGNHGVSLFQNINGNFFIGPLVNGFTRNFVNNGGGSITFQNFANLLPSGTVAQVCTNDASTPFVDESICNNRQFRTGGVTQRANTSHSSYNSLQARYNGRFLNDSLNVNASYTWSKTMDDSSEIFALGDIASPNAQNPFCINKCEFALSDLDRPQAFSLNFILDVPFFKQQKGFVGHLLGGWQINSTYILTSGAHFTPNNNVAGSLGLGGTYLTAGDRPFWGNPNAPRGSVGISQIDANLVFGVPCNPSPCSSTTTGFWSMNELQSDAGDSLAVNPNDVRYIINGPGAARFFGTPFGNVPRNSETGPIFNNLNMSLFKNIRVRENMKLQLRAEAFNFLNHPNPGFGVASGGFLPDQNLTDAGVAGSAFNNFQDIAYANRVIQVGIRFVF